MRSVRLWVALAVLSALTGCASWSSVRFEKEEESGVAGDKIEVLRYLSPDDNPSKDLAGLIKAEKGLADGIKDCERSKAAPPPPPFVAAAVPIVAALAQLGVNIYFEKKKQRIEEIVEASKASYSASMQLDPKDLLLTSCFLLVRYAEDPSGVKKLGLAALMKVEPVAPAPPPGTQAVVLKPLYIRAATAAAQTRKADEPTIGVSVALSVKALGLQQSQLMRLLPTGEGVTSVANVVIGKTSTARCIDKKCKVTDMIPFPATNGPISVTMSIAEQGVTGFDDKLVLAEIAAIKEALGPAISDAVKAKFED